ncbi:MAG: radical SAM protein [Betaproteobacteria bacterium]|nr:radical SAM protein [Betaproteobacteria bacterium]
MYHAIIFSVRTNPWERSSGAHRIATFLRRNGMDVEVIDFAAHWETDQLQQFVKQNVKKNTIFFGFSIFFNYWNENLNNFTNWLKINYPNIKTVAGGQHIMLSNFKNIDIIVDSYGEQAMLAIARSLAGNSLKNIKFSLENFGKQKVVKALNSYPSFDLQEYSIILETRDYVESWEWLTIEFARGCKFSCKFCNFPILGLKNDNSRSKEDFEYELKYNFDNFGVDRYYVADETFNDRIEKISKFADVVDKLSFKPFFSGFIRADLLSKGNMIEELARMNFGGQYYGVETFNKSSGQIVGKGLDPERVKKLITETKSFFKKNDLMYRGTISLITGLPKDTKLNWEHTIKWLRENWLEEAVVIFPLEIEDVQLNSSNYTNLSHFAKNYKKYGIRITGKSEIERYLPPNDGTTYNWKAGNYTRTESLWEHDTMNIFQAKEISDSFNDAMVNEFKIDSWQLSFPEIKRQRKLFNLKHKINITKTWGYPDPSNLSFVNKYALRKLNKI